MDQNETTTNPYQQQMESKQNGPLEFRPSLHRKLLSNRRGLHAKREFGKQFELEAPGLSIPIYSTFGKPEMYDESFLEYRTEKEVLFDQVKGWTCQDETTLFYRVPIALRGTALHPQPQERILLCHIDTGSTASAFVKWIETNAQGLGGASRMARSATGRVCVEEVIPIAPAQNLPASVMRRRYERQIKPQAKERGGGSTSRRYNGLFGP